jgi:hypothetical protein
MPRYSAIQQVRKACVEQKEAKATLLCGPSSPSSFFPIQTHTPPCFTARWRRLRSSRCAAVASSHNQPETPKSSSAHTHSRRNRPPTQRSTRARRPLRSPDLFLYREKRSRTASETNGVGRRRRRWKSFSASYASLCPLRNAETRTKSEKLSSLSLSLSLSHPPHPPHPFFSFSTFFKTISLFGIRLHIPGLVRVLRLEEAVE